MSCRKIKEKRQGWKLRFLSLLLYASTDFPTLGQQGLSFEVMDQHVLSYKPKVMKEDGEKS